MDYERSNLACDRGPYRQPSLGTSLLRGLVYDNVGGFMTENAVPIRPLLVYTMTSGLGDLIVMGDLMLKIEKLHPSAECLIVHRANPHTGILTSGSPSRRFFNVYSVAEMVSFRKTLREFQARGYVNFGLQMAPGSLQGFLFYALLKRLGLIEYIVDFNLVNADIITAPRGDYILELHLNQFAQLLSIPLPADCYRLNLPLSPALAKEGRGHGKVVGVHPWSRRGHLKNFVWQDEKWLAVISHLVSLESVERVVVFGRDPAFDGFCDLIRSSGLDGKVSFSYSNSVQELIDTVETFDCLVSVNTSVVHIGYSLGKDMVVLCGPSLDIWTPKAANIRVLRDQKALFQASDKWVGDQRFGSIARIEVAEVLAALVDFCPTAAG